MRQGKLLQVCLCKEGGMPLEMASRVRIELGENKVLSVKRASTLSSTERDKEVIQAQIKRVIVTKTRIERGLQRADVILTFENEKKLKLWLPRRAALKSFWLKLLGAQSISKNAEAFSEDDEIDEINCPQGYYEALYEREEPKIREIAAKLHVEEAYLPQGWQQFIDVATGNQFYFEKSSGRTTWSRPRGKPKNSETLSSRRDMLGRRLAVAWLLQQCMRHEVSSALKSPNMSADAPILYSLLDEFKVCPLFTVNKDWAQTVDNFLKKLPELMHKAEIVSGVSADTALDRDGAFHLAQAVAQPLFIFNLADAENQSTEADKNTLESENDTLCTDDNDYYSEIARAVRLCASKSSDLLLEALVVASNVSELPEPYRALCRSVLPLATLRLCRASRPSSEGKHRLESVMKTLPYSTLATAVRVGAFPTSSNMSRGLVDLFVKRQLSSNFTETIAQQVVRASLGLNDDEFKNMYTSMPPNIRRQIQEAPDIAALEKLPSELAETGGIQISAELQRTIENSVTLEVYKRRSEELVAAYGDPDYVDSVSRLYPALLEPVTHLLNDAKAQAADCISRAFLTVKHALTAADDCSNGKLSTADRALLAYTDLARLTDNMVQFLHVVIKKHAAANSTLWHEALRWLQRLIATFSLSLDLPVQDDGDEQLLQCDINLLLEKWHGEDTENLAALATLTESDLPYLASLIPAFTTDLRRQWSERRGQISSESK